ncbi:hypothetical protein [Paeniglutamicibacter psychrophenolicus]|uniref:hypothetical protein n=1 Tax=Paeniglutamicibacter psychrophenolicus TaxID=257454 RepID=UPI0027896E2A|nr:hypothetical protein [Paeniglutamicibacter psychrophenolicus]MDQ0093592.1 hypothetical protein [Paeniglutamicibacter psychrophenolicus]
MRRNVVERSFNALKHWRGMATRYDKPALTCRWAVVLHVMVIRASPSRNHHWETRPSRTGRSTAMGAPENRDTHRYVTRTRNN